MIFIKRVASAITAPVRTTGAVAGQALDLAVSGVRSTARLVNGAVRSDDDDRAVAEVSPLRPEAAPTAPATKVTVTEPAAKAAPAAKPAAKKAPAKKSTGKKTAAKKAPSAKAATAGPAVAASKAAKAPKPTEPDRG